MTISIAQLTDTHLLDSPEDELRGVKTWHSLKAVLAAVAKQQPDRLLLTGDLADVGSAKAYQNLINLVSPLNLPASWLPDAFHHHRNSVDYYGCPSTCTQVVSDDTIDPTVHQPGFRQLHLYPNGDHETAIHRVANALSRR